MKSLAVFLFSAMLLAATDGPAKKPKEPAAPQKLEIPKGAVQDKEGSYHYTDKRGTKWIYRKTPFGVARYEDKPAAAAQSANTPDPYAEVKAIEAGDTVRFERVGPFGTYKWERKKSELNDMEKAVWDRERAKTAGAKQD